MKARMKHYLRVLVAKFSEPSSWKGITLLVSAGGWNRLDSSNKGEVLMQVGLVVFALILIFMSQESQYGPNPTAATTKKEQP